MGRPKLTRRGRAGVAPLAVCLSLLLAAVPAAGQDSGPTVVNYRADLQPFALVHPGASLELLYRYQQDQREPTLGGKTVDTETLYRQTLELYSDAFIMHPNLVDMSMMVGLGFDEESLDSQTDNRTEETFQMLSEFDFSATILKNSDTPLTLYANRAQTTIDRQFSGSLDSITTTYGGSLGIRSPRWRHHFNVFRQEQDQQDHTGLNDFGLRENVFEWQSSWNIDPQQLLEFDYSFKAAEEFGRVRPETIYDRHDAQVTHTLEHGSNNQHRLRSFLQVLEQVGDFPFESLRLDEQLHLLHSHTFDTRYDLNVSRDQRGDLTQTQRRGRAQFRHRLYQSLVTTGSIGISDLNQSDDFQSKEFFGDLSFDYTKRVPHGLLSMNLDLAFNQQDNSDRGTTRSILAEPHTFNDPLPVILAHRNVVAGSIEVRQLGAGPLYLEGFDYTVTVLPDRVEIRRVVPGGGISDGETVEITYDVGPDPSHQIATASTAAAARLDITDGWLAGFGLYSRYQDIDQDVHSDVPIDLTVNSVEDLILGADYRRGDLFLEAEYEIRDSTLSPFRAMRLEADLTRRVSRSDTYGLSAAYTDVAFVDDGAHSSLLVVTGSLRRQLTRRLSAYLAAAWRHQEDSFSGETDGIDQKLTVQWEHRQTSVFLVARNSLFFSDTTDNMFQTLEVGLRREF